MEAWIKGMLQHQGMERVKEWDVINEPIADNNQWRGIDGNFMSNGEDAPDTAPVEDEENGLNLNWANDHFYWGYYIGKEYAVKAFEYARKYAAADVKLYVNDYNLETNPSKLAALIDFVNYIEDNGQTVDGIGTQMHVTASSITREQIDAMFKTMAATGKLVRVTELDVALGTSSPSAEQLFDEWNPVRPEPYRISCLHTLFSRSFFFIQEAFLIQIIQIRNIPFSYFICREMRCPVFFFPCVQLFR